MISLIGGSSVFDEKFELMLHRRLLHDDINCAMTTAVGSTTDYVIVLVCNSPCLQSDHISLSDNRSKICIIDVVFATVIATIVKFLWIALKTGENQSFEAFEEFVQSIVTSVGNKK